MFNVEWLMVIVLFFLVVQYLNGVVAPMKCAVFYPCVGKNAIDCRLHFTNDCILLCVVYMRVRAANRRAYSLYHQSRFTIVQHFNNTAVFGLISLVVAVIGNPTGSLAHRCEHKNNRRYVE